MKWQAQYQTEVLAPRLANFFAAGFLTTLTLLSPLNSKGQTPSAAPQLPCCTITALDARRGLATARENATGRTFDFGLLTAALRATLKVGQPVFANFTTRQVSLDGRTACCQIVNLGAAQPRFMPPSIPGAPAPGQKPAAPPFGRTPCCHVTNFSIATRIATAKINFSGQTFQFRVTSLPSLSQLSRVGQGVYANFKTLHVSLDGTQPCGQIVAFGPKPATMPPPITLNPPHLPPKPSRVVPTLSARLQPHALGQVLPLMQASGGSGVVAANALIALPWNGGLADQYAMLAKKAFSDYVSSHLGQAGQPIASGGGTVGIDLGNVQVGADWHYTLTLAKATPYVDLSSGPPGFLYASLTGEGGNPPGFVARAPLNGSWNFGATAGVLVLDAGIDDHVGDSLDWSVSAIALTAGVSNFNVTAGAQVDSSQPDRPMLVKGDLSPQLTLSIATQIGGAPVNNIQIPIAFTLELQPGSVAMKGHFASAPIFRKEFNSPVNARLTGDTALTFTPKNRSGDITATASLTGYLEIDLINPANGQNLTTVNVDLASLSIPFDVPKDIQGSFFGNPFDIALLSPSILAQLTAAFGPLPPTWPTAGGSTLKTQLGDGIPLKTGVPPDLRFGGATPPPPNPLPNFADVAQQLEAAMDPRHIPYGAILMRDSWLSLPGPTTRPVYHALPPSGTGSPITYGRLADSAIWTGHYLAAESFRYAATNDQAALDRVRKVLKGVQLLFDITTDVIGQNCTDGKDPRTCEFLPVPPLPPNPQIPPTAGRILARSVLPSNSPYPYTLDGSQGYPPEMVREHDGKTPCFYIHPEGGWAVGNKTYPTLAAAIKDNPNLQVSGVGSVLRNQQPILNPRAGAPTQAVSPNRNPVTVFGPIGQIVLKPLPVGTLWYGVGCGKDHDDDVVSRDQYDGIMMGLAFAYALVPVPAVQGQVRKMVDAALDYLVNQNHWNLPAPPPNPDDPAKKEWIMTTFIGEFDLQLDFLRIGATVDPPMWDPVYQQYQSASALAWIPVWITTFDPVNSYFGFNLSHAAFSPALFLEQSNPAVRQNLLTAYKIMRRATAAHQNAYFDLVRILVEQPAQRAAVASGAAPSNPNIPLSAEITSLLSEWLARLSKVQAKDSPFPTNAVPNPQDIQWLWYQPQHVAVYTGLNSPHCQILATFALPVESRPGDRDYIWEDPPFETGVSSCPDPPSVGPMPCDPQITSPCGTPIATAPLREAPAVDYLLPYWMAVYVGLLK